MKAALAEHFHSLQGEGFWVGTPMHFIRLAGCSVGRKFGPLQGAPQFPNGEHAWQCQTWDGRKFWCDTDFHLRERVEIEDLIADTYEHHICITGGEPLIHQEVVWEIGRQAERALKKLHIETSGTIDMVIPSPVWVTVAPKLNVLEVMLERANEIKLLVDRSFDPNTPLFSLPLDWSFKHIYLSPVNGLHEIWEENKELCLALLKEHPNWKLSVQLHKYLGVH